MTINSSDQEKLKYLRAFLSNYKYEDLDRYELYVWELAQTKNIEILCELLELLDDNFEQQEILWSILHSLEAQPPNIFVLALMKKAIGRRKYHEWYVRFIYRILNSKKYYQIFLDNIHIADKNSILKILEEIYLDKDSTDEHRKQVEYAKSKIIGDKIFKGRE